MWEVNCYPAVKLQNGRSGIWVPNTQAKLVIRITIDRGFQVIRYIFWLSPSWLINKFRHTFQTFSCNCLCDVSSRVTYKFVKPCRYFSGFAVVVYFPYILSIYWWVWVMISSKGNCWPIVTMNRVWRIISWRGNESRALQRMCLPSLLMRRSC